MFDISKLSKYRENSTLEAKQAVGGLPVSLWETYSAFANTGGGIIALGIEERKDKSLCVCGVSSADKLIAEFFDILNDKQRVSANVLRPTCVRVVSVEDKEVVLIRVPRAPSELRPVFIGGSVFKGSYFRKGESDCLIPHSKIEKMLAAAKKN